MKEKKGKRRGKGKAQIKRPHSQILPPHPPTYRETQHKDQGTKDLL
jgi:hypothetical protein